MLRDARMSSVKLYQGPYAQAYAVDATRGDQPIEMLDKMHHYSLEWLLRGAEQSLLDGLTFARDVERLKQDDGQRLHLFGRLDTAHQLLTMGELVLRLGGALSAEDQRTLEEAVAQGDGSSGLRHLLALHSRSSRLELGYGEACARSLQARRTASAAAAAAGMTREAQLEALEARPESLVKFFDQVQPAVLLDVLRSPGIYIARVDGELKIGVATNGAQARVQSQGKVTTHVVIALFFASLRGKGAGGECDTTGCVTWVVEALEALCTIMCGGLLLGSAMYGSPKTLMGRGCAQSSARIAALRALAARLGAVSLYHECREVKERAEQAVATSDEAAAQLEAAEAQHELLALAVAAVVEGGGVVAAAAEAAVQAAQEEVTQAAAAVERAALELQALRAQVEQAHAKRSAERRALAVSVGVTSMYGVSAQLKEAARRAVAACAAAEEALPLAVAKHELAAVAAVVEGGGEAAAAAEAAVQAAHAEATQAAAAVERTALELQALRAQVEQAHAEQSAERRVLAVIW